ncbi:MAG: hypothetical protein O9320_00645 [Magnetospirillum sp.]|nr:hypothetical protein [Magnetospirillum sp.]
MFAPDIKQRREDEDSLDGWFDLADTIGLGRMNGRRDVFKVESILADAGDLDFAGTNGPSGYGQYTLDDGVRKYQKRNGLKVDGWLRPDGPTVTKMREQFGDRFAGFPAPTQEQIEQHHALAAEGQDGLLVARPPRIELKKPKNYPPVDPETHGSNTSWVEYLTRNRTNFDGAPEMLATYIKNFGARGVLQARDFVEQWDAAKPGEGPDVVAAVLRHLDDSVDRRAFVGGDLPQSPPIGTLRPEVLQALARAGDAAQTGESGRDPNIQLAMAPALALPPIAQGLAAGLGAILGGLGTKAIVDQATKPGQAPTSPPPSVPPSGTSDPLPGRSPAPPAEKPRGLPELNDEDRMILENIPVIPDDARKEIGGAIAAMIVERSYADREDRRGSEATLEGNNILARECKAAIDASRLADVVEHIGGASRDGEDQKYMKETMVGGEKDQRGRFPDYSMGVKDKEKSMLPSGHINTASTRADGSLSGREQRARDAIAQKLEDEELIQTIPKFREGDDPKEYAKIARAACDRVVGALEKHILDANRARN